MGRNCSCLKNPDSDDSFILVGKTMLEMEKNTKKKSRSRKKDKSKRRFLKEVSIQEEFDMLHVIVIQSILRGFLERHKAKKRMTKLLKSCATTTSNKQSSMSSSLDFRPCDRPFLELFQEKELDIMNYAVKSVYTSLDPFEYYGKIPKATRKSEPVLMENNSIYAGYLDHLNHRQGHGVQIWTDGSLYEGSWCNDKREGKGRMIYYNGNYYEGCWKDDQRHGYGILVETNKARYEGYWENGLKHGRGFDIDADENKYDGIFENGIMHGKGKIEYSNGNFYSGDISNGCLEGKGIFQWKDGRKYEGKWKNNKMHGKGLFTWNDGRVYKGEFFDDQKYGYGIFTWPDGRMHEGQWKNDKQDGEGMYTTKFGTKSGVWKNGKRIND